MVHKHSIFLCSEHIFPDQLVPYEMVHMQKGHNLATTKA